MISQYRRTGFCLYSTREIKTIALILFLTNSLMGTQLSGTEEQIRDKWRGLTNTVSKLWLSWKTRHFLIGWQRISSSTDCHSVSKSFNYTHTVFQIVMAGVDKSMIWVSTSCSVCSDDSEECAASILTVHLTYNFPKRRNEYITVLGVKIVNTIARHIYSHI
jgi:hypothetical protein